MNVFFIGRPDVEGLEYMNDDPSEVDVLYLQVQELAAGSGGGSGEEEEAGGGGGGGGKLARVCKTVAGAGHVHPGGLLCSIHTQHVFAQLKALTGGKHALFIGCGR